MGTFLDSVGFESLKVEASRSSREEGEPRPETESRDVRAEGDCTTSSLAVRENKAGGGVNTLSCDGLANVDVLDKVASGCRGLR